MDSSFRSVGRQAVNAKKKSDSERLTREQSASDRPSERRVSEQPDRTVGTAKTRHEKGPVNSQRRNSGARRRRSPALAAEGTDTRGCSRGAYSYCCCCCSDDPSRLVLFQHGWLQREAPIFLS
ncbi:hypothetical protein AAFF_G00215270 [Aldrovandia affinis]|uniref:Uncharacterized protein n=1 Tax=Aldrovandia affinis TaxID=143900 RepID=A0AAD7W533_9TELE|nr:hypothetical protein AAFF_G00215270 [Aldrovandia affinis]